MKLATRVQPVAVDDPQVTTRGPALRPARAVGRQPQNGVVGGQPLRHDNGRLTGGRQAHEQEKTGPTHSILPPTPF